MTVWDNRGLAWRDQFAYWRETICLAFVPLSPRRTRDEVGFPSRVEARGLGAINRTMIASQPQHVGHGPREVSETSKHCYFVNLQLGGTCATRLGDVENVVRPGQFVVVDTAKPYYFEFSSCWRMMSFKLPHHLLDELIPSGFGVGVPISATSGTGKVVASLMLSLWGLAAAGLPAGAVSQLEQAFAAASAAALGGVAEDSDGHGLALRMAIDRHVQANVGDPKLSVAVVAARFNVSPRTLHKLYAEGEDTFATMVRTQRMHRAAELLRDTSGTRSISEIAELVGMPNPASFSRAFRRQFGMSPRELRANARG
jgi:AraC-like DNA-binding protein